MKSQGELRIILGPVYVCWECVCVCICIFFFLSEIEDDRMSSSCVRSVCTFSWFALWQQWSKLLIHFSEKKKDQRVPLQVSGMVLVRHFLLKNAFQQKWLIQLRLLYDIIEQDCHVLLYCSQCGPTFPLKWKFANKYET